MESETPASIRRSAVVIPIDHRRVAKTPVQRRILVIGDCENDTSSVEASLRFVGLRGKQGKLKKKARGAHIVQTGDLVHKSGPDLEVIRYWEALRGAADAADCTMHFVAGNHELEVWRRLSAGHRLGLKRSDHQAVLEFIRGTKLFHVDGSMLFIHGYPTVSLLRHIQAYRTDTGKVLNDYNRDCFQPAFDEPKQLARYAYPRRNACRGSLLHDVSDPARYFRRHGKEVAALLEEFGIDLVVHGHKPERSGVQTDYELQQWLPGIRMISNDIQLRLQGLGATVIRQVEKGPTDVLLVNKSNADTANRSEVRGLLRPPSLPAADKPELRKPAMDGPVSNFVRNRESRTQAVAAK